MNRRIVEEGGDARDLGMVLEVPLRSIAAHPVRHFRLMGRIQRMFAAGLEGDAILSALMRDPRVHVGRAMVNGRWF